MINKLKDIIKKSDTPLSEWLFVKYFERREKNNIKISGLKPIENQQEEKVYHKKWERILKYRTPYAYKLYSYFIDSGRENIVSEVACIKVNSILNPNRYIGFLSDKNNFDLVLPKAPFPKTYLRKIGDKYYDADYNYISQKNIEEHLASLVKQGKDLIIKQTIATDSGRGVYLVKGIDSGNSEKATRNELREIIYDKKLSNLIVQERLKQHLFLAQFNPTSINTIRVATYRSVVNNEVHILSTVIRLGASGKYIDNLHAGGHMVRVSPDGKLADFCIDQYGTRFELHNGISTKGQVLPNYDEIKKLVKELSSQLIDLRLIQWDIMLDENGVPRVIEFNSSGFSMWIAQMTGTPAFGSWTDEIIQYCESKLLNLKTV